MLKVTYAVKQRVNINLLISRFSKRNLENLAQESSVMFSKRLFNFKTWNIFPQTKTKCFPFFKFLCLKDRQKRDHINRVFDFFSVNFSEFYIAEVYIWNTWGQLGENQRTQHDVQMYFVILPKKIQNTVLQDADKLAEIMWRYSKSLC